VIDAKLSLFLEALRTGHPQTMVAHGRSMEPAIRDGTRLVLTLPTRPPKLGDVVAVVLGGTLVIHRVVGVRDGAILLMGDAHSVPDGWVQATEVVAVTAGGGSVA
jgi:phage repressor protein C with HTH and peptisase S24 domain